MNRIYSTDAINYLTAHLFMVDEMQRPIQIPGRIKQEPPTIVDIPDEKSPYYHSEDSAPSIENLPDSQNDFIKKRLNEIEVIASLLKVYTEETIRDLDVIEQLSSPIQEQTSTDNTQKIVLECATPIVTDEEIVLKNILLLSPENVNSEEYHKIRPYSPMASALADYIKSMSKIPYHPSIYSLPATPINTEKL